MAKCEWFGCNQEAEYKVSVVTKGKLIERKLCKKHGHKAMKTIAAFEINKL